MNPQLPCSQRQWVRSSVGRASHQYREVTGSNSVEVLNFFQASLRNCINCVHFDDLFFIFISFTQFIWFISYIINTNFFHGNIWTHNWPAPNISGFISQLVERASQGYREVTGSNPVEVLNFFFQASLRNYINCVHCDDHFFIFRIWCRRNCLEVSLSSDRNKLYLYLETKQSKDGLTSKNYIAHCTLYSWSVCLLAKSLQYLDFENQRNLQIR